jgi:hypothetical protein
MITNGNQIRAARALIGWTRRDLADAANLHPQAVSYWERSPVIPPVLHSGRRNREPHACQLIREAFGQRGVQFINEPHTGVCVVPDR